MMKTILTALLVLSFSPSAFAKPSPFHFPEKADFSYQAPLSQNFILPAHPVVPFYQWGANNGYCGETSLLQAGMNQAGQWMSQYNSRLVCGTGLSQSGPDGFCAAHQNQSNYNAQVLIENMNPGDATFASAPTCLKNARLSYEVYPYAKAASGMAGYQQYLSWIKAQMIAGNQVTIAVLDHGGDDEQYDHEVTVSQIGTNHAKNDPAYYDDDVLYFDDHQHGGAPFSKGYPFQSLAKTREQANASGAQTYSILIPGKFPVLSGSGGNGIDLNPHSIVASNYAVAVSGPADTAHVTLPVTLTLVGSSINGVPNTAIAGNQFNFESPSVGVGNDGCTNYPPKSWMGITLQATVSKLTVGVTYHLIEYELNGVPGVGTQAMLPIPDSAFNAHANQATRVTAFTASSSTYSQTIQTTSDKIVVFRCVRADAP